MGNMPVNKEAATKTNSVLKPICLGILAHVDAGKTTLSERMLYETGKLKAPGRVDHGDAFLDTDEMERERGITIFSKQARFSLREKEVTLLDTPGHADFSAEMERTLQVLDYAILVISASDGVQSHTLTLWRLLQYYGIPVFLFVNKMDQPETDPKAVLKQLQKRLDERCLDFSAADAVFSKQGMRSGEENSRENAKRDPLPITEEERCNFLENLALCDERLMDQYMEQGSISLDQTCRLIQKRKVFPCYFGSALKGDGIAAFLEGLDQYTVSPVYGSEFGARVYKITRDEKGSRLTHMKITGGALRVKDVLTNWKQSPEEAVEEGNGNEAAEDLFWHEKVDQIRLYDGTMFQTAQRVQAGSICAVTGLSKTYSGQGIGAEPSSDRPVLEPVLTYEVKLPEGSDVYASFLKLRRLEEEAPQLHLSWDESLRQIHAQLMGEIETEVLQNVIRKRLNMEVTFGSANIVYKETIAGPVEGVGHFEPLRHYAEVHLLLEPGEAGSGLTFASACSEDMLEHNWQRLILSHLAEKRHKGVLTGSDITDMKITLIGGRAHLKHTEGGDFRQATYRAVRQGLRKAQSILLEPVYRFELEIPTETLGRAMSDIQKMDGRLEPPETDGEQAFLKGTAPVIRMRDYQKEVLAYTKGRGRLFCSLDGYAPCKNADSVIEAVRYDPEADLENPTGSVFCTHGAGFTVLWDQVEHYMHLPSLLKLSVSESEGNLLRQQSAGSPEERKKERRQEEIGDEAELEAIFQRTYGTIKRERRPYHRRIRPEMEQMFQVRHKKVSSAKSGESYLLVDGYNIIFAWEDLNELARTNIEGARNQLAERLSNYQGYKQNTVILVFDAYKVPGGTGSVTKYNNIYVIYTKEAETADQYIEKAVNRFASRHDVTVATSDHLVQMIIWGEGALRLSARGLREEIEKAEEEIRASYERKQQEVKYYPFEVLKDQKQRRPEKETEKKGL